MNSVWKRAAFGILLSSCAMCAPSFAGSIQRIKSFSLPLAAPCSQLSGHLAPADFNGDGKTDVVFVHSVADDSFHCHAEWGVLLNQGNGQFTRSFGPIAVGGAATTGTYVAVGDFDQDGHMDVVVGAGSEGTFHVFLGTGSGTFTERTQPPVYHLSSIADIDVADTNGDGILDIGVVDGGQNQGAVVYVGDGTGSFVAIEPAPSNDVPSGMRFVDVDNNGTMDIVMINSGRGYDVAVNDGHGNFSARPGFQDTTTYDIARLGDMNNDGLFDLVTNTTGGAINVQRNQGSYPYFQPATALATGGTAVTALRVPDFDGDGKRDLAAAIEGGPGGADIVLLTNLGNGYAPPSYFTTGLAGAGFANQTIEDMLVRDIDGDGKTDFVALGPNELAVFVSPPDRVFRNGFEAPLN